MTQTPPHPVSPHWQPHREPLRATLLRTGLIALIAGAILALASHRPARWPAAALLLLWPALGGHYVEILFLNHLRPRLPSARPVQIAARLALWFLAGIALSFAMRLTATALTGYRPAPWPRSYLAGLVFVAVELLAHLILHLRHRPSLYNSRP